MRRTRISVIHIPISEFSINAEGIIVDSDNPKTLLTMYSLPEGGLERRKVIDTNTNEIFPSLRYMCSHHDLHYGIMRKMLTGIMHNPSSFMYLDEE